MMLNETPIPCFRCGTCCIAPDISTLSKPVGVRCRHLREDRLCGIYPERPAVCRAYRPDEICVALQCLAPDKRVAYYLEQYGLTSETPVEPGLSSLKK
jgi:hypothetical protein